MHESILALGVVREVEKMIKELTPIKKVRIVIGELQRLDEEVFRSYLDEFLRDFGIIIEYELVVEKAILRCASCGSRWTLDELGLSEEVRELIHFLPEALQAYTSCPNCNSRLLELSSGRGIRLVAEGTVGHEGSVGTRPET